MLLPSRVAGRTLRLRGPDLARGPEVARLCITVFAYVILAAATELLAPIMKHDRMRIILFLLN